MIFLRSIEIGLACEFLHTRQRDRLLWRQDLPSAGEVSEDQRPSSDRILWSSDESRNRRHVDNHHPVTNVSDTIDYVATDTDGLTATSTRMVIIEPNPSIVPTDDASTTDCQP